MRRPPLGARVDPRAIRRKAVPANLAGAPISRNCCRLGLPVSRCTSFHVSIPRTSDPATAIDELVDRLGTIDTQFAEILVDHCSYPALAALINGEHAWLTLFRYDGDAGFSSRNPQYRGPDEVTIPYLLGNGQLDHYPAAWAHPTAAVLDALLYFARTRRTPETIAWFNDSGDGSDSPNAAVQP